MKTTQSNQMPSRNRAILIYILATLFLTGIALAFYFSGFNARHPNVTHGLLYDPAPAGSDLTSCQRYTHWPQRGAFVLQGADASSLFNYCPFAMFLIVFLLNTFRDPVAAQTVFIGACALAAAGFLWRKLSNNILAVIALATAVCTSFPFLFLFRRGNIEGFVWLPCVAGAFFFVNERYVAAALLFGAAASIKPFPAMLLLLFLPRRRYREFLIGCAFAAAVSAASLCVIGPSFATAFRENLAGFRAVQEEWVLGYLDANGSHSLFTFVKQMIRVAEGWPLQEATLPAIRRAYPYYQFFAIAIFAASVIRLRKLPVLNQMFGLFTLMIWISPINFDYTLIDIYVPWAMLLLALSRPGCRLPSWPTYSLMVACAVLFTSQYYLLVGYSLCLTPAVKTFGLLAILIVSVTYPLPTNMKEREPGAGSVFAAR